MLLRARRSPSLLESPIPHVMTSYDSEGVERGLGKCAFAGLKAGEAALAFALDAV
jgi:hypothetical protein